MKKLSLMIVAGILASLMNAAMAQKITVKSGSLDFLKSLEVLKVEYNYEGLSVGDFKVEDDYIQHRVSEMNTKEPGTGDKWKESWFSDRAARYQPRFETEMNNLFTDKVVPFRVDPNANAKYTMIFKTLFIEPGFNVGMARKDAYINAELTFFETGNPGNVVAIILIEKSPGRVAMGMDFDTGMRIQEAYAKAGKELAQFIWKNLFVQK